MTGMHLAAGSLLAVMRFFLRIIYQSKSFFFFVCLFSLKQPTVCAHFFFFLRGACLGNHFICLGR